MCIRDRLWTINKDDVSQEISSIRGYFLRDREEHRWVYDNDEQYFSKDDNLKFMIKYAFREEGVKRVVHFPRYYSVNISDHIGDYFDPSEARFQKERDKDYQEERINNRKTEMLEEELANPYHPNMPPKQVFLENLRSNFRRGRSRGAKRWALIQKIDQAKHLSLIHI